MVALGVVIICALLNIAGVRVVSTTSLWLFFSLVGSVSGDCLHCSVEVRRFWPTPRPSRQLECRNLTGLLICMWNYMGWDNASTIATEVERPQRTYPRAMLVAVAIVASVTLCRWRRCG